MKVLKFGGSSLGNPEGIKNMLEIVSRSKSMGEHPLVVCSALHGVTNYLLDLIRQASGEGDYLAGLKALEKMHTSIVKGHLEASGRKEVLRGLRAFFEELKGNLTGVSFIGESSTRTTDKILSYGELCSAFTISHFIAGRCGKAVFADTRRLIKTDSNYGKAGLIELPTNKLIREFVDMYPEAIPVFTGFIASNKDGDTTTLGRGGSDYTAAIVASALDASEIQIWTDVDGIMTADPRMVKRAFSLKQLSYNEAVEMSYFGAKVIHPPTMFPARAKNIPIVIKNTFNRAFEGTVINGESQVNGSLVKGISFIPEVSLITVQGVGMVGQKGFSGRLFTSLAGAGANVILITQASSEHSISLAVTPSDRNIAIKAIEAAFEQDLATGWLDQPQVEDKLSIIAVVGERMRHTRGLAGRMFSALGRSGVNVIAIAQGSSELNISVVIDSQDLSKAMNSLHDAMFLSPVKTLNVFCCGLGNIGKTLLEQMGRQQSFLEEKRHVKLNLAGICNSKRMFIDSSGIPMPHWPELLKNNGEKGEADSFIAKAVALNLPNPVFIDNTGSVRVAEAYTRLFENSISVVACNKIGNSGPYAGYLKCKELSQKFGVDYWYETTVGAGLPIIKTLHDLMISGDEILKIEAILSGTISYIFNQYTGQRTFAEVVREARAKGLSEPDPRDDLSGMDFARKMLILARETGLETELEDIMLEPVLPENCLNASSVENFFYELEASENFFREIREKAGSQNQVLRYIGKMEGDTVRIELRLIGPDHPFHRLSGSENIVSFTTRRYLDNPMVIKGPGAGAEVTAAGVLADLVRVAGL